MYTFQVLWSTFFKISCLQLKPQDLPKSNILLIVITLNYVFIGILLSIPRLSLGEAILSTLLEILLLTILVGSLLYFTHFLNRLSQTLTALMGTNTLLGWISLPVLLWYYQAKLYQWDISILLLGLTIWNLVIYAHILRHALDIPFFTSLILSLIIFSMIADILIQLFPLASG